MGSNFDLFNLQPPLDDDGWTDGLDNGDDYVNDGLDVADDGDDDDDPPMPSTAHHNVESATQNATPADTDTYEDLVS